MNSAEPIAALEIGTTHTMIAIAEPLGEGRIRVAAYGSIPSSGSVHKSQVVDVAKARYSVSSVQKKLVSQFDYAVAQASPARKSARRRPPRRSRFRAAW